MGFLEGIEKLINEHGSSAILRERLLLASEQFAALERQVADLLTKVQTLETKIVKLESEKKSLELDNVKLQEQLKEVEKRMSHVSNPKGYACDHCGSQNLKRTGNVPDPTFGDLGVKMAVFTCNDCNQQSRFSENPR